MRSGKRVGKVVWYLCRGQWQPGRVFYVTTAHPRNPMLGVRSVTPAGVTVNVARRAAKVRTRAPRRAR